MKLIDKSALVAEIERRIEALHSTLNERETAVKFELKDFLSFIDTLEVKEVDLEEETRKWWKKHLRLNPANQLWMDAHQSVVFAKHFYELGLQSQKGSEL